MADENLELELLETIKSINAGQETEEVENPLVSDEEAEDFEEQDNPEGEPEAQDELEDTEPPSDESEEEAESKGQTPEQNRLFAERRRQQELEKRVQEELDKRLQELPEVKAARLLKESYGIDADQLIADIENKRLQEEADRTGIPYEVIKRQADADRRSAELERQVAEMQYQLWEKQVQSDAMELQKQYPMLTEDDLEQSVDYILSTLQNTEVPLKQAVMALHADKILNSMRDQARNEILAEKSGRKAPLAPSNRKTNTDTKILTAEEEYIAKQFGMTADEYIKYK